MVAPVLKSVFYRGLLPFALIFAAVIRPCFLSIGYLFLALLGPVLPSVTASTAVPGGVKGYVCVSFVFSLLTSIAQIAYQIYEPIRQPSDHGYSVECPTSQFNRWMRQSGFIRFHAGAGFDSARCVLPEIVAVFSSLLSLIFVQCLSHESFEEGPSSVQGVRSTSNNSRVSAGLNPRATQAVTSAFKRISNAGVVVFVALVGSMQPSILNSIYFIAFLFISTWWSTYKPLRHGAYNKIKMFLIFYTSLHILIIYVYQIPEVHNALPETSFTARLLGLSSILTTNCDKWYALWINPDPKVTWNMVANPVVIISLYYILVLQLIWTRHGSRSYIDDDDVGSSVHEENETMDGVRLGTNSTYLEPSSTNSSQGQRPRGHTMLLGSGGEEDESHLQPPNSVPLRKLTSQVIDKQKISQIFNASGERKNVTAEGLVTVISFFIQHSYVLALLSMMTWALLYHSIFGLILLLWTCILWMFRDTRKASFGCSPLILLYVEFLLCVQYVCSMDVDYKERLHLSSDAFDTLQMVGFIFYTGWQSFEVLMAKVLLSLPVFLLFRLRQREVHYSKLTEHERLRKLNYGTFTGTNQRALGEYLPVAHSSRSAAAVGFLSHHISKYWIFFAFLVLLIVSLQGSYLFNVGFFALWIIGILVLKLSFRIFRGTVYLYWTTLIFYTAIYIISLYVFQFKTFSDKWRSWTHIDDLWTKDIGLVNYSITQRAGALFVRLLSPICLFVVAMLQLKFFHDPWTQLVQPVRDTTESDQPGNSREDLPLSTRISRWLSYLVDILWRFLEVHIAKIVFAVVIIFAAHNLSAVYVPLVVLVSLAVCFPSGSGILGLFLCAYLAVVALAKMIFQMHIFTPDMWNFNSTSYEDDVSGGNDSLPCDRSYPFTQWLGFRKEPNMFKELAGLLFSLITLAAQSVVVYRQRHLRIVNAEPPSNKGRVFPELDPITYDHNMINCFKFFVDFGFYKFGLECCCVMMAINAWTRMDMLGAVIVLWLGLFSMSKRSVSRAIWPIFLIYLMLLLPIQYAVYVGFPPNLCINYPWSNLFEDSPKTVNMLIWLGLADPRIHWTPHTLLVDFFLLLMASCQAAVFRQESSSHPAGDNESIYKDGVYAFKDDNPYYDFVNTQRSFVDYFKKLVFMYGHWISVVMVLVAGLGGTSLFALGYLCLSFWILWQGNNLYIMKNHQATIRRWMILLGYTVFVMFCKVSLQVLGCVFLADLQNSCFVRQLFSVICVNDLAAPNTPQLFPGALEFDNTCAVQGSETRIGFDTVALAFLVIQLRILHTWYFQHCMIDYRAEIVLANRGAVLANQLIEKEMKEQTIQQDQKFGEIKRRTDAIRAQYEQQQQLGRTFEPQTYGQALRSGSRLSRLPSSSPQLQHSDDVDEDDPLPFYDIRSFNDEPLSKLPAKRAGDYYMFDYDPNTDELVKPIESFVPEVDPEGSKFEKLDPTQMVHTAINKDLDVAAAMKQVEKAERLRTGNEQRMIAAVTNDEEVLHTPPEMSEDEDEPRQVGGGEEGGDSMIVAGFRFVHKMVCNLLDWISAFLNRRSREHRYVAYVLAKEKQKLKSVHLQCLSDSSQKMTDVRRQVNIGELKVVQSESDIERLEHEALDNWQSRSVLARLGNALADCVNAHTDIICFMLAVIAHGSCAGLITMPLPLMVFFWGTLSNPRPSKFFWIAMIAYTEFLIVVKFLCQFGFMPFNAIEVQNQNANKPYAMNKVFGVQKKDFYAFWDVALLVFLFYHRYNLRRLGLWKDANVSETFQDTATTSIDPQDIQIAVENRDSENVQTDITQSNEENEDGGLDTPPVPPTGEAGNAFSRFIYQLFHPKFRYIQDLYPFMFAVDILCFFIISFGYSGFGEGGSGNVVSDIQSNRIPFTFVIMLVSLTLMIVIDRGLYLRKAVYCKLVYQFIIVVFMHVWIFIVLPSITQRDAASNSVARFLYIVKCVYLLISAWQIRNGYPTLCIGNLLTHAYGLTNMVFFKIFMAVPFLFELRTAIDWTWTDTSMPLFDFFNMENFYSVIYNLKCGRNFEQRYPAPRGVAKGVVVKYLMGIPMILLIVLIIWCPLIAFSLLNRIGMVLTPSHAQMSISIEGYPPLYQIEAQGNELISLGSAEKDSIVKWFSESFTANDQTTIQRSRTAVAFIDEYTEQDTLKTLFRPESETLWDISLESKEAMLFALKNQNGTMKININLKYTRPRADNTKEPVSHTKEFQIDMEKDSEIRKQLVNAIEQTPDVDRNVYIPKAVPLYLVIPNEGEVGDPSALTKVMAGNRSDTDTYVELQLELNKSAENWIWSVQMDIPKDLQKIYLPLEKIKYGTERNRNYVEFVAFVDRTFPSFFAKYVQGGIIAMYIALVIFIGKILRGLFTNSPLDVIISEIPNPDYLLKICLDIYLVREAKDFVLEQDLFAKLIFLFRSPATLIKWTRYKVKDE